MLKGFKEFVLRGNVIDLAVAVVVGAAFTAVVNAIVASVLNPLVGSFFNAEDLATALPVRIGNATLQFGAVIGAIIQFLLVAAVIYFAIIVPINYLKRISFRRKAEAEPAKAAPPTELELLADIRDLLADRTAPSGSRHAAEPVTPE